jgi:hypothetical protein
MSAAGQIMCWAPWYNIPTAAGLPVEHEWIN